MKFNGFVIAVIVLILAWGGWRLYESVSPNEPDQVKIERALDRSIRDSKEGRPGGVLDLLSQKITINQANVGADRRQIADFIKNSKPSFDVQNKTAQIFGDEARIVSPVGLSLAPFGERTISEVTLIFQRESDRAYGIIPVSRWKLVDIRIEESVIGDLIGF